MEERIIRSARYTGVLAWIATYNLWGLTWSTVWPLAIVGIGAALVWRSIAEQRPSASRKEEDLDENGTE